MTVLTVSCREVAVSRGSTDEKYVSHTKRFTVPVALELCSAKGENLNRGCFPIFKQYNYK